MALDQIGRRSRKNPTPKKRVAFLTDRDFSAVFEPLHRHGFLATGQLKAYNALLGMNQGKFQYRLTQLLHETDTPHNGRYLELPKEQFRTAMWGQENLYKLRKPAKDALAEKKKYRRYAPSEIGGMWTIHEAMCATLTASMELATLKTNEYSFIFQDEILERAETTLNFKVKGEWLKPDRIFGIKGPRGVMLFLVEVDRATETNGEYMHKLDLYKEFIQTGAYRKALKVTGAIMLINFMSNDMHMRNVMKKLSPNNYMLFKSAPIFDAEYRTPPVMTELFTTPWERVGKESFSLDK